MSATTNAAPAYFFHGMTFCAACALPPTALGILLCGGPRVESMDEAIAYMVMLDSIAGNTEDSNNVPVAVSASGVCENCGQPYGTEATADEEGAA